MLDPIAYEDKYKDTRHAESASQRALFMYANMAANFGLNAANDKLSYSIKDHAKARLNFVRDVCNIDDRIPQLKYLFAIHNQGHGDAVHGARAVAEGLKKGVPDVALPISVNMPRDADYKAICKWYGYSGLYIELKRKQVLTEGKRKALIQARSQGRASTEQEDWQAFLRQQGYVCEICYGFEEARDLILRYLKEGGLI